MATTVDDLAAGLAAALASGVAAVAAVYRAAACSVALLDDGGDHLRFVAAHGEGESRVTGMVLPAGRGIAAYVTASGSALVVADVGQDPRFARAVAESTGYVPATILAAPLIGPAGVIGVTEVLDPGTRERDLDLLGAFGALFAGLVTAGGRPQGRLAAAVERLSLADPATQDLAADLLDVVARNGSGR